MAASWDGGQGVTGADGAGAEAAAWATWWRVLLATVVQATVPRAARPIAPPTCWPVLSRLEARPESSSRTRDRATSESGTNSKPRPVAVTRTGPSSPPR